MHVNRWKLAGSAALLAAALTGCGGPLKYAVHGSPKAPEMDANIVADVNKDGNFTNLKIDIEHLAPPDRLGPGGKMFVVWTKGDKPKWHRVGAMSYDEGGRKSHIEGASVPVTTFDLQVTVEQDAAAEQPSGNVVVFQRVN